MVDLPARLTAHQRCAGFSGMLQKRNISSVRFDALLPIWFPPFTCNSTAVTRKKHLSYPPADIENEDPPSSVQIFDDSADLKTQNRSTRDLRFGLCR